MNGRGLRLYGLSSFTRPLRLSRESSVPHLVSLVSCLPSRFARLPSGFALRTVTVGGGKQGGE